MHKSRLALGLVGAVGLSLGVSSLAVASTNDGNAAPLTAASMAAGPAGTESILSTKLRGIEEVPGPGDPDGRGEFSAILSHSTMCYSFAARKIGPAVMAHIHDGDRDVAGPVVITLQLPTRNGVTECIHAVPDDQDDAVTMSMSELAALKSAPIGFYVNAHTAQYPSGAIRGQLNR